MCTRALATSMHQEWKAKPASFKTEYGKKTFEDRRCWS